jgi:hypothetical protein
MSRSAAFGLAAICVALLLAGCAGTYATNPLPPPRDFSGNAPPSDMATVGGGGDMGVPDVGDMSVATVGDMTATAIVDMTAAPVVDMAAPVVRDLMPACAPSIADDGGVAPGLHLAAPGPSHTLFAARFDGKTWTQIPTTAGAQVADVAMAVGGTPARPVIVARMMTDSRLDAAIYDPCYQTWSALSPIRSDAWTALRPSLIGNGGGADVVFRGGFDQKLYWSHFDGTSWGAIATNANLLSDQIPIASYEGASLHAVYNNANDNQTIYDGTIQASGGVATKLGGTTNFAPAAVATGNDSYVVFTGQDTFIYWFKVSSPGNIQRVCPDPSSCSIFSPAAPSMSLGSDGSIVVIYLGNDGHVYSSALATGASSWTAAVSVSGNDPNETSTLPVAVAPGIGDATVEAVYVNSKGVPRHARLVAGTWQVATVAAVALTGAAALAVSN